MAMDIRDELEMLDNQLYHAREALEHLECVDDCEDLVEIINDRIRELTNERDRIHANIEAQDDHDLDALRDEYWRDAM